MLRKYFNQYFELCFLITALLALAWMDPSAESNFSLCVFKWMSFESCPGCGLGHSISWLFRGELEKSFNEHPFGIFAVAVLLYRIYILLKNKTSFLTA